jgi:hypothetical protein
MTAKITEQMLGHRSALEALRQWAEHYVGEIQREIPGRSDPTNSSDAASMEALQSLLRRLGVQDGLRVPQSTMETLLNGTAETANRAKTRLQRLSRTVDSPLADPLNSTDMAIQTVWEALVDCQFALSLKSPVVTQQITELSNHIQSIQQKLQIFDHDLVGSGDQNQIKFVSRWS